MQKKRWFALLLALVLVMSLLPISSLAANVGKYADVSEDEWYADAVKFVTEKGLMNGVSETAFAPDGTTSRAMIVTILYRAAGSPEAAKENPFEDVPAGAWFTDAVRWASETGVVTGYDEKTFGPDDAITREQLALILFRYAGWQGADVSKRDDLKAFSDADAVSGWAKEAVQWAVAEGLINGVEKDVLSPGGSAARAQAAAILMRFLGSAEEDLPLALVQSVDCYGIDYETNDWELQRTLTYEYENGYPVRFERSEPQAEASEVTTFVYTFEDDGLPATREDYDEDGVLLRTTAYRSGSPFDVRYQDASGAQSGMLMYQYGNGDGYFTLQVGSTYYAPDGEDAVGFTMEEVDSVQVTTANGLLQKTVNSGIYANWNDGDEKQWERFNGTYAAEYDADGILKSTSSVFRMGPPGAADLLTITRENGRITEIVHSLQYAGQDPKADMKLVFHYTDTEISPARYAMMINDLVMGTNNYYVYFWY